MRRPPIFTRQAPRASAGGAARGRLTARNGWNLTLRSERWERSTPNSQGVAASPAFRHPVRFSRFSLTTFVLCSILQKRWIEPRPSQDDPDASPFAANTRKLQEAGQAFARSTPRDKEGLAPVRFSLRPETGSGHVRRSEHLHGRSLNLPAGLHALRGFAPRKKRPFRSRKSKGSRPIRPHARGA